MISDNNDIEPVDAAEVEAAPEAGTLAAGIAVIKAHVKTLPRAPGVYRMIDAKGDVVYVGKARFLRNRVSSYTQTPRLTTRLMRMVAATASMEFVVTGSEAEALLLESNLIKKFRPRFNVMLKDDKSFPYILIRRDHPWPQLVKHRGARQPGGDYFGPFASAGAVNRTLYALQRAFPLALVLGCDLRQPHAALLAISDQALHRALHQLHQPRRLQRAGRRSARLPLRPQPPGAGELCPGAWKRPAPSWISNAPLCSAIASRR